MILYLKLLEYLLIWYCNTVALLRPCTISIHHVYGTGWHIIPKLNHMWCKHIFLIEILLIILKHRCLNINILVSVFCNADFLILTFYVQVLHLWFYITVQMQPHIWHLLHLYNFAGSMHNCMLMCAVLHLCTLLFTVGVSPW